MTIIAATISSDTHADTTIYKYGRNFTAGEFVEECRALVEDLYDGGEPSDLDDAEVSFKWDRATLRAELGDFGITFTMRKF